MSLKENILTLRQQGLKYSEIVTRLGCAKSLVSYHCSKLPENETIRQSNLNYIHLSWSKKQKNQICYLYKLTIPVSEIADILNLPYPSLRSFCKNLNQINLKNLSNYEKVKLRRKKLKILAIIFKGGKCELCNYNTSWNALEFHHTDPLQKDFSISQKCNTSWQAIKKEVSKCQLLCANCHREVHDDNFIKNLLEQI